MEGERRGRVWNICRVMTQEKHTESGSVHTADRPHVVVVVVLSFFCTPTASEDYVGLVVFTWTLPCVNTTSSTSCWTHISLLDACWSWRRERELESNVSGRDEAVRRTSTYLSAIFCGTHSPEREKTCIRAVPVRPCLYTKNTSQQCAAQLFGGCFSVYWRGRRHFCPDTHNWSRFLCQYTHSFSLSLSLLLPLYYETTVRWHV